MTRAPALSVLLLAAFSFAGSLRAEPPRLLWSKAEKDAVLYSPTLDASLRASESGLLVYVTEDDHERRVAADGSETDVPRGPQPGENYGRGASRNMAVIRSPGRRWRVQFDAGATFNFEVWMLPIPSATLYDNARNARCTYHRLLDEGYLSDNGDVFVSHGSHDVDDPTLDGALLFFDCQCQLHSTVIDLDPAFPWYAAIAGDGSLFVWPHVHDIVAYSGGGAKQWTYQLPANEVPIGPPSISRDGSFTAIRSRVPCTTTTTPRLLDAAGRLLCQLPAVATHTGEFSGDKASLLMWSSAAAYRVSTSTGQVVWQSPEGPHGLAVRRAVMSADGSYVAVLHALAPDTRNYSSAAFPVQLAVAVYRGNELILAVDLPRDDDQVAKEPPGDPLQITLADDAKYLTVATTRTLRLYRLF